MGVGFGVGRGRRRGRGCWCWAWAWVLVLVLGVGVGRGRGWRLLFFFVCLRFEPFVRCLTRQDSARVKQDFEERPDTNRSLVHFAPGEMKQICPVIIKSDGNYESEVESFKLKLGSPFSPIGARLESPNELHVSIIDKFDKPLIRFRKTHYEVDEPPSPEFHKNVTVVVERLGDRSKKSVVRLYTQDGLAKSGDSRDYLPVSLDLVFEIDDKEKSVSIEILYDDHQEIRESFAVQLSNDREHVAFVPDSDNRATVYIKDAQPLASVTFPTQPVVVSLRDYDNAEKVLKEDPVAGYPLICISPCNPKHPEYDEIVEFCEGDNIDDSHTQYTWQVAMPNDKQGVGHELRSITKAAWFAPTDTQTLDSVYFQKGYVVRCATRAITKKLEIGRRQRSKPSTISDTRGICPRNSDRIGAEPFSAHISYTGTDNEKPELNNLVKIQVLLPHTDGMLPVISTERPTNFGYTLSNDALRYSHKCSNLLDFDDLYTKMSFNSDEIYSDEYKAQGHHKLYSYQYDSELRTNKTLRFYRSLNLQSCIWKFEGYFDMTELISECGAIATTDGQVLNQTSSFGVVKGPLYVSQVYSTMYNWQSFDQQTELGLRYTYSTSQIWDKGIGTAEAAPKELNARVVRASIRPDGRLVVTLRTRASFRGQFIDYHPSIQSKHRASVKNLDQPEQKFTLKMVSMEETFDKPGQEWQFISDFAHRDFTGAYEIKLIPCRAASDADFSKPPLCNPREPLAQNIHLTFQQVSDPVSAKFKLDTDFYLLSQKDMYLSHDTSFTSVDADVAFPENADIYGRVIINPIQKMGEQFTVKIDKVFLCAGKDNYVPRFSPVDKQFGCLTSTKYAPLLYKFKVLDRDQPDTTDVDFRGKEFEALLAFEDPDAKTLQDLKGSDGFRVSSAPLFQVELGINWYLHVIYSVTQGSNKRERRHILSKRDAVETSSTEEEEEDKSSAGNRIFSPRQELDIENLGKEEGTNIELVRLNRHAAPVTKGAEHVWEFAVITMIVVLLATVVATVCLVVFRRKRVYETRSDGGSSAEGLANSSEKMTFSRRVSSEKSSLESTKRCKLKEQNVYFIFQLEQKV